MFNFASNLLMIVTSIWLLLALVLVTSPFAIALYFYFS